MLTNTTFLITGIADKQSLAMYVAKEIIKQGGSKKTSSTEVIQMTNSVGCSSSKN